MKPRTLLTLVVATLLLGALAWWLLDRPGAVPPPEAGQRLLASADVNAITRVEIASGTQQVALVRNDGNWTVETLWNFPARFSQLADFLRGMDNLRVAEIIRGGTSVLGEFGLADDGTNFPARIKLFGSDGKLADDITMGNPRITGAMPAGFNPPDSRYARAGRGPVVLVEPFLDDIRRRPSDWMETSLLDIRAEAITRLTAAPTNDSLYGLSRTETGYTGINTLQDQPINKESADIWFRAFRSLSAVTVVDPSIDPGTLGRMDAELVTAHATNGIVARVELGAQADDTGARYAWLSFEYEGGDATEPGDEAEIAMRDAAQAEVERLQREVAPWTFVFSFSQARKFIFLREQLIAADAGTAATEEDASARGADAPPGQP